MPFSDYTQFAQSAYDAGMAQMQATMSGVQYGASNMVMGASVGYQKMMADIGSTMPGIAPANIHPMMVSHHGMYAHEMSFTGSLGAMFRMGIPKTTTAYEYQQLAGEDLGQRFGSSAGMAALYSVPAAAAIFGSSKVWNAGAKLGRGIGRRMGLSMGSRALHAGQFAGAIGLNMAAFGALDAYVGAVSDDVTARQDIMNFLDASSFRYMNTPGPDLDTRFGTGFNRGARARIANQLRDLELKDHTLDMGDVQQILEGGTELGIFNGVRDAEEFGKKFKDLASTVKQVTKTLHLTLSEGLKAIKDLKDQGYITSGDVAGAVIQADVLGTSSGRTAAEMLSIGRQGAEMVRGTGIAMSAGSTMMQQNFAMVTAMRDSGTISRETIAQAGGEEALAQRVMATNIGFMSSSVGRATLLAMGGPGGTLDAGRVASIMDGGASLGDIVGMAAGNIRSPADYIRAVNNQQNRFQELSRMVGGQGIQMASLSGQVAMAAMLQTADPNLNMEDALRFQMLSSGATPEVVEAQMGMLRNPQAFREKQAAAFNVQANKAVGEILRGRAGIITKSGDLLERTFVAPVGSAISGAINLVVDVTSNAHEAVSDKIAESLFGVRKTEYSVISNERAASLILGSTQALAPEFLKSEFRKDVYSEEEKRNFVKSSESYKQLDKLFGKNLLSSAASRSKNKEDFAKAVAGKSWSALSKDERMYLEDAAERLNLSSVQEDIVEQKERSLATLEGKQAGMFRESKEKIEEAEQAADNARMKAFEAMGFTVENGGSLSSVARNFLSRDKEAAGLMDTLLMSRDKMHSLEKEKAKAERLGEAFGKQEELEAAQTAFQSASISISGKLRKIDPRAAEIFGKNVASSKLFAPADMLASAKKVIEEERGSADYNQLLATTSSALDAMVSSAEGVDKAKLGGYTSRLRDIIYGDGSASLSKEELESYKEIASKGGLSTLSETLDLGLQAMKKGQMSLADTKKFLEGKGFKIPEGANLKNFFGDDGADYKEILRYTSLNQLSWKSGGKNISGGSGSEVNEEEAKTITKLVDTQRQIAMVADQLEKISSRLNSNPALR